MAARQQPKILQARRGFTCDAGNGPVYVPRKSRVVVRDKDGGIEARINLEVPEDEAKRQAKYREIVECYPEHAAEWFDVADEQPVIVRAGQRYPSDHAIVKGREELFEEVV